MKRIFIFVIFAFFSLPVFSMAALKQQNVVVDSIVMARYGFYKDQTLSLSFMNDFDLFWVRKNQTQNKSENENVQPSKKRFRFAYFEGCRFLPVTYNFSDKTAEVGLLVFRFGLCAFGPDFFEKEYIYNFDGVKLFIPVYAELNFLNALYDNEYYFFNPEINIGAECNVVFNDSVSLGVGIYNKISLSNICSYIIDGSNSIKNGLRGTVGIYKPEIFVSLAIDW